VENPKVMIPTGLSLMILILLATLWLEGIALTALILMFMVLAGLTGYAIGFTHNHHRSQT